MTNGREGGLFAYIIMHDLRTKGIRMTAGDISVSLLFLEGKAVGRWVNRHFFVLPFSPGPDVLPNPNVRNTSLRKSEHFDEIN